MTVMLKNMGKKWSTRKNDIFSQSRQERQEKII